MANRQFKFLHLILLSALVTGLLFSPLPTVFADTSSSTPSGFSSTLQSLELFAQSVANGRSQQLVGIYSPNVMSFSVVQQPAGNSAYVSTKANALTQFCCSQQLWLNRIAGHTTRLPVPIFTI